MAVVGEMEWHSITKSLLLIIFSPGAPDSFETRRRHPRHSFPQGISLFRLWSDSHSQNTFHFQDYASSSSLHFLLISANVFEAQSRANTESQNNYYSSFVLFLLEQWVELQNQQGESWRKSIDIQICTCPVHVHGGSSMHHPHDSRLLYIPTVYIFTVCFHT